MASAPLAASLIKVYAVSPEGHRTLITQGVTEYLGPGGSPDAVIANTPEKWAFVPLSPLVLGTGWKVVLTMILGTADGVDVSDGAWQIPVTIRGVGLRHLTVTDLGGIDLPAATSATVEHDLGTGYTVPTGQQLKIGGGKIWVSAENDA